MDSMVVLLKQRIENIRNGVPCPVSHHGCCAKTCLCATCTGCCMVGTIGFLLSPTIIGAFVGICGCTASIAACAEMSNTTDLTSKEKKSLQALTNEELADVLSCFLNSCDFTMTCKKRWLNFIDPVYKVACKRTHSVYCVLKYDRVCLHDQLAVVLNKLAPLADGVVMGYPV